MTESPTMLTTAQFARRAGVSAATVTAWLRQGKIRGVKKGRRWQIPADQLPAGDKDTAEKTAPAPAPDAAPADRPAFVSVQEFAARTYLTEKGVERWLRQGKLAGRRTKDGRWEVAVESLQAACLRHLLRN